jgi:hypothetical protein
VEKLLQHWVEAHPGEVRPVIFDMSTLAETDVVAASPVMTQVR